MQCGLNEGVVLLQVQVMLGCTPVYWLGSVVGMYFVQVQL